MPRWQWYSPVDRWKWQPFASSPPPCPSALPIHEPSSAATMAALAILIMPLPIHSHAIGVLSLNNTPVLRGEKENPPRGRVWLSFGFVTWGAMEGFLQGDLASLAQFLLAQSVAAAPSAYDARFAKLLSVPWLASRPGLSPRCLRVCGAQRFVASPLRAHRRRDPRR